MSSSRPPQTVFRGYDLTLRLLAALAELPPAERDAWIDRHVLGLPMNDSRSQQLTRGMRRLREALA